MAISENSYMILAKHIVDECNNKQIDQIMSGDFSCVRMLILDELMFNDYKGVFLDVIMEDMFTQKKKPYLRGELEELADFLLSDLSPYLLKAYVSKHRKK